MVAEPLNTVRVLKYCGKLQQKANQKRSHQSFVYVLSWPFRHADIFLCPFAQYSVQKLKYKQ